MPRANLMSFTLPIITKNTPTTKKSMVYLLADFRVAFLSSISIEPPVMAAFTTIATNKEAVKVTVKVIGK